MYFTGLQFSAEQQSIEVVNDDYWRRCSAGALPSKTEGCCPSNQMN